MDDAWTNLYFDVQQNFSEYRQAVEAHIIALRRLLQTYDHLSPHEYDGNGWHEYVLAANAVRQ